MSKSLVKFFKGLLAPKVLIDTLKSQDPKELGTDTGNALKKFIHNEFGDRAGGKILVAIRPWLDRFFLAFRKILDD